MERFDAFTSHIRRKFSFWVSESLVYGLEDAWDHKNFNVAFYLGEEINKRVPESYKTQQFHDGIELLSYRMETQSNQLVPKTGMGQRAKSMENMTEIPRYGKSYHDREGESLYRRHEYTPVIRNIEEEETQVAKGFQYENSVESLKNEIEISANGYRPKGNVYLGNRLESMEGQLESAESSTIRNEKEKERLQNMTRDLQERIDTLRTQNDIKDKQLKTATKKLTESENKYEDLFSKNINNEQLIEYFSKELGKIETIHESLKSRLTEKDQYNEQLKEKLASAENEKRQLQIRALSRQQHDRTKTTQLEDRIKQLETEKQEMDKRFTETNQHAKTIKQLEEQLASAEKEKREHQNRALSRQRIDRKMVEELEDRVEGLQMEKQDRLTDSLQYAKIIEQLEAQLASAENENRQLQNRVSFKQQHDRNKAKELEDMVRQLETEKHEIVNSRDESEIRLKESEQQVQSVLSLQDDLLKQNHKLKTQLKAREKEVNQLNREMKTIKDEKDDLQNGRDESERGLRESEQQVQSVLSLQDGLLKQSHMLKMQLDVREREVDQLKLEIKIIKDEKDSLQKSRDESERGLKESEQQVKSVLSLQDSLLKQNHKLKTQLKAREKEVNQLNREMKTIKDEKDDLQNGNHTLKTQLDIREKEVDQLNFEMITIKDEKDDLQIRFNKVAVEKQASETPTLCDLSGKHRTIELSEVYSELYDNEWTRAFSVIEGNSSKSSEESVVKKLKDILMNCYGHCVDTSKRQLDSLNTVLLSPNTHKEKKAVVHHGLITDSSSFVSGLRKQTYSSTIDSIKKEMTSKNRDSKKHPALKAYMEKCAELCWLMVVQSPPVYIDDRDKPGSRFDKNIFKAYTRSGPTIDFVVWPPVFLHQGGPLLCKGTAQGRN